jgi:hypothetical protein
MDPSAGYHFAGVGDERSDHANVQRGNVMRNLIIGAAIGAALTGCAVVPTAQTADEFRQQVKGSSLGFTETIEVPRPHAQVSDALRRKSKECLAVTIVSTGDVYQGNMLVKQTSRTIYKPTLTVTKDGTELAVQSGGHKSPMQKVPDGGYYVLVADAKPAGKNATSLTIYRGKIGKPKDIDAAIRGWARGDSMGCPDLNR